MKRKKIEKKTEQCDRFLCNPEPKYYSLGPQISTMSKLISDELKQDFYGCGEIIEVFEGEMAELLGKESALFMPSGTMAQQIALRIWADRAGCNSVAFHPTCHLELHEEMGYRFLHGLHGIHAGSRYELLKIEDLEELNQPLGSLVLELPQREIGGQLPEWEELTRIIDWARSRNIYLHMDGARLWQCKPLYQKEYAEISNLFDSVYVSLYKDMRAIAGAILAGRSDFIAEARIWLRRHGGNLVSMFPFVLTARYGTETYLPMMDEYRKKALEVAEILADYPMFTIKPNPPHTNMMHLFVSGDKDTLEKGSVTVAEKFNVMLFNAFSPSQVPGICLTELTILDSALELDREDIISALNLFCETVNAEGEPDAAD